MINSFSVGFTQPRSGRCSIWLNAFSASGFVGKNPFRDVGDWRSAPNGGLPVWRCLTSKTSMVSMAGCVVHVCCSVLDACCMSLVLCARFGCMVPGFSVLDVLLSAGRVQTVMCGWSPVVAFFIGE